MIFIVISVPVFIIKRNALRYFAMWRVSAEIVANRFAMITQKPINRAANKNCILCAHCLDCLCVPLFSLWEYRSRTPSISDFIFVFASCAHTIRLISHIVSHICAQNGTSTRLTLKKFILHILNITRHTSW